MAADSQEHVNDRTLVAYAAGMIDHESTLAIIEEHLLMCQECRDVVDHVDRCMDQDSWTN